MPPSENGRRPGSDAAAEAYIVRLVEEMADAAGGRQPGQPDVDLDIVEERLAQLRALPAQAPDGGPAWSAPAPSPAAPPVALDLEVELPAGARPTHSGVAHGTVDEVILAAAAASGLGPVRLVDAPTAVRPKRRRRGGLYLTALLLTAIASGLIYDRSLIVSAVDMLETYWSTGPVVPPLAGTFETAAAPPDAIAMESAMPGQPLSQASVWRKVKTFRVDADGQILPDASAAAD
ncbi:MAG: hypothetical protein IPK28_14530 [Devosia sp.]|nr:hypothetical protein [Devosia sp.]